jgi:hypothetical protein
MTGWVEARLLRSAENETIPSNRRHEPPMDASPWTLWTARICFLLYVLALCLRLLGRNRSARLAWAAGFGVFVAHMVAAFQFEHHWSHADAYAATARKTGALTGLDWGGGLYANYVLAALWLLDVVWWIVGPRSYLQRPAAIEAVVQGFFAFLWFNATVVFGHGPIRPIGAVAFVLLAILAVNRLRHRGDMESGHGTNRNLPRP